MITRATTVSSGTKTRSTTESNLPPEPSGHLPAHHGRFAFASGSRVILKSKLDMMMAKAFRGGNDRDYLLDNVLDPPTGPCPQDTGEGTSSCPAGSAAEQTPDEEPEVPEGAAGSNPAVHTYVASCVAALGGFLFGRFWTDNRSRDDPPVRSLTSLSDGRSTRFVGYDIGIISGAKAQMQRDLELTSSDLEWVVSILPAGALIASLTGGKFMYI